MNVFFGILLLLFLKFALLTLDIDTGSRELGHAVANVLIGTLK